MKLLEEKIKNDGQILEGEIIKVDSFLNHQLDIAFLEKLGEAIQEYFSNRGINKILTIEASGIALATCVSQHFGNIPVLFCKKQKNANLGDSVYQSQVKSYTAKKEYTITASKKYLGPDDHLLIIDDFLAEGNALKGLIDVAAQAGAHIEGVSVAIEKGFQEGGKIIREAGYDLLSLAIIDSIDNGEITFRK